MLQSRKLGQPALLMEAGSGQRIQIPPRILEACRSVSLQIGAPRLKSLGVTSTIRGEGRTTMASAFAFIQAADYRRSVVLLELDFDRPSLADRFGLELWPGLAELTSGQASLAEVVQPIAEGICVITAGAPPWSVSRTAIDVVRSDIVKTLSNEFEVVIGDLPALLSTCGHVTAELFEQLVLVVRAGITPIPRVREVISSISPTPALLLNGTHSSLPRWLRLMLGR